MDVVGWVHLSTTEEAFNDSSRAGDGSKKFLVSALPRAQGGNGDKKDITLRSQEEIVLQ